MTDANSSDESAQPCEKAIIETLSDDESTGGQDAESQPPAVAVPHDDKQSPAKVRARISFLVGTACICSRARKTRNGQFNRSCHRQFRGDVDRLTALRLKLHGLAREDMNAEVWSMSNSDSIFPFGRPDRWFAY